MVFKKISILLFTILCVLASGCTNNQGNETRIQTAQDNPASEIQHNQNNPRGTMDNRIRVAAEAAVKITNFKEVRQANVRVTQRNASS
jgi:hypothetical protein